VIVLRLDVSERSKLIVQSEIRNMTLECNRVGGINLAQGVCDLEVPVVVIEGAYDAMRQGINMYTRYDGLPVLREAIAHKFRTFNKMEVDPEGEIVASAGATGAFYCTCMALLNPGDEVIVLEPFYQYHVNTLLAVGARPVCYALRPPDWSFDIQKIQELVTDRTRAIVVNTPSNPCGKVFTKQELRAIGDLCIDNDIFLFTDEIYEYFVYDGLRHLSPGSFDDMRDRTIIISGYSKTFSITGWRVGYCVCDKRWAQMIGYVNDLVYVNAPAPLQVGVAKGIMELPSSYYRGIAVDYQMRRDKMVSALREAGLEPHVPSGAYYILADVSSLGMDSSKEAAMEILRSKGIASVPGSAFYMNGGGEDLVRFCFAKKDEVLARACGLLCGRSP
jgi:aminotransferase